MAPLFEHSNNSSLFSPHRAHAVAYASEQHSVTATRASTRQARTTRFAAPTGSRGGRMQIPRGTQTPDNSFAAGQTSRWNMPDEAERYDRIGYGGQGGGHRGFAMKPKKKGSAKKKVLLGVVVLALVIVALVGVDFAMNNDKVHAGVKVEGVEIGGLSKAEATTKLQAALDSKLAGASIQAQPDAAAEERLSHKSVSGDNGGAVAVNADGTTAEGPAADGSAEGASSLSWSFVAADLGASINAAQLVDEAYEIGQVNEIGDIFSGLAARFASLTGQVDLPATIDFDATQLTTALKPINDTIGIEMVNSNLNIDAEGQATVRPGQIGEKVDETLFADRAQKSLLSSPGEAFFVPLKNIPLGVNDEAAQKVADQVNLVLTDPVTIEYEDHTWGVGAPLLGSWIATSIEGEGTSAVLVAAIDPVKAYSGLQDVMGEVGYGSAVNARIDVSSGTPVIVGGTKGIGPDLKTVAGDLQNILFGEASSRRVVCTTAEVEPAVTAEDVASMGIVELINTYQLGYGSGGGSNREFNIERCLDKLNGSIIAPGQSWNWNEVVGLCDTSTGYKDAGAINEKNELVQEPGGGICNVATGVFNAAYEAGLPIYERANHSQYMENYPLGRDAAVSWEYPTLVFQNDTDHSIMVTARYDGSSMFISIWGTNPHRSVESKNSDWADAANGGKTITNYRTVRAADGSIWIEDSFYSYFPPKKEEAAATA